MSLKTNLRVCVLQPDYSTSAVDYQHYDPRRDLSTLLPDAIVDHVFLNKLTTYKQLKETTRNHYDIYVNLCEAYLEWEVPSIDVIHSLDLLNLPYTGPTALLYDPSKELMKYVAYTQNVQTTRYCVIKDEMEISAVAGKMNFPLFIKPAKAGDSLGIDKHSLVKNKEELRAKVLQIIGEHGPLLAEEYIAGREFTVLLVKNAHDKTVTVFNPVEFIFPEGNEFKTYALKTSELHTDANVLVTDPELRDRLKKAASDIFLGFGGVGYARLDFRTNEKGELYFLEINFTCSVFYKDGYEGSADYILKLDGTSQANFLQSIIEEGIERYAKKQKKYYMKGDSIAGYGIYAIKDVGAGEIIFQGEERSQRIATQRYIHKNWPDAEIDNFKKYAYPVSNQVFLLWDEDPAGWAPQNHSCEANTAYRGLDVISTRSIKKDEELTLDYSQFLGEHMEPFHCKCGSAQCKGYITGTPGNSISSREEQSV